MTSHSSARSRPSSHQYVLAIGPATCPTAASLGRHRVMGEFHRLGARVGGRLHLEITRVGVGRVALSRHGKRWYAGRRRVAGGCGLSCESAIAP